MAAFEIALRPAALSLRLALFFGATFVVGADSPRTFAQRRFWALSPNGSQCNDPGNPVSAALGLGGKIALAGLMRTDTTLGASDFLVDSGASGGFQLPANPFFFNRAASFPPPGACTAYMSQGDVALASLGFNISSPMFDPGTLNIDGPEGMMSLTGNTMAFLGAENAMSASNAGPYLDPGSY